MINERMLLRAKILAMNESSKNMSIMNITSPRKFNKGAINIKPLNKNKIRLSFIKNQDTQISYMKTSTSTNRSRINQTNTVVPSILKNYAIDSLIHRSNVKSKTGTTKISFSPNGSISKRSNSIQNKRNSLKTSYILSQKTNINIKLKTNKTIKKQERNDDTKENRDRSSSHSRRELNLVKNPNSFIYSLYNLVKNHKKAKQGSIKYKTSKDKIKIYLKDIKPSEKKVEKTLLEMKKIGRLGDYYNHLK